MKKILITWFSLTALTALTVALVRWSNHPNWVEFAKTYPVWSALFAFGFGWLLRRFILGKDPEWVRGLGLGFVLFWTQTAFLVPVIPSHDFDQRILWPWAMVFSLYLLLYMAWEEWTEYLENLSFVQKIPAPAWSGLFAVALLALAVKVRHLPTLMPKGDWTDLENFKNLALVLMLVFWGFVPFVRRNYLRLEPKVFRALGLFLFTLLLYREWPDFLNWTYYDTVKHVEVKRQWTPFLIFLHFLLSAYVAVFWEKLRESRWPLRAGALTIGFFPLLLSTYFNPDNLIWLYQIAGLAFVLFWDPWLKARWWDLIRIGGAWWVLDIFAAGKRGYSNQGNYELDFLILTATALACGWRVALEKIPQSFLRTLWIMLYTAFLYRSYHGQSGSFPWQRFNGDWLLFLHLAAAVLIAVYWERLRDSKEPLRKVFLGAAIFFSIAGSVYVSFIWFFQWFGLGILWAWDAYGHSAAMEKIGRSLASSKSSRKKGEGPAKSDRDRTGLGADLSLKFKAFRNIPWVLRMEKTFREIGRSLFQFLRKTAFSPKIRWAALGLAGAVVLYVGGIFLYRALTTHVVSMTPTGTVTSQSTVIRVKFSGPVVIAGDLQKALRMKPDLSGTIRLEDDTTLVFTPSQPLRPATRYDVSLDGSVLKSKKGFLQRGASSNFNTPDFRVSSCRLFYTYDLVKGTEKEIVGELEFNYPVDLNALKGSLSVYREGETLSAFLEPGTIPNRFFFRAGGLSRVDRSQTLRVEVAKDLKCVDCGNSLEKNFKDTLTLPAKPIFEVKEITVHHQAGNSFLAVLFSHPVSREQVKAHLTVSPSLSLNIQTEYCYAVLKGDFKPNLNYRVRLESGLRSMDGEILSKPVSQDVYLHDAGPRVRFADKGRLIPLDTDPLVAVKTMNLDDYRYNVRKVFRNNLVAFLKGVRSDYQSYNRRYDDEGEGYEGDGESYQVDRWSDYGIGAQVTSGSVTVEGGQINEEVETTLDFSKWHAAPWKGLITVEVSDPQGSSRDSRWFLATDLGLLAKRAGDDLWMQALSISGVKPKSGVRLSLISDNNQVIQEQVTDESGRAWFKNWKKNPYDFRPLVVVAEKEGDWSFLRLDQGELHSSRFDVSGESFSTEGWEGFLTTDRGLYRPGDTVHFTGMVRHADLSTPEDIPVRLKVFDTGGTEMARIPMKLSGQGLAVFKLPLRGDVTTGSYSASLELETGRELARTEFKAEEFIPNKIKAEVVPESKTANAGEQLVFNVKANHLFGAAAAKLKVQAHVLLREGTFKPKQWKGYKFSDDSRSFDGETLQVPDGQTDDWGVYSAKLPVPLTILPASMLEAVVFAEVFDTGGRPVGASSVVDVHRYPVYLGIKNDAGRQVSPGQKLALDYVAVSPDGKTAKSGKTQLVVKRKIWYSVFRRSGWSGRGFESSYYEEAVIGKEIEVNGKGVFNYTPDKPGEYTVYLGNSESMRTSLSFVATGLGSSPDDTQSAPTNMEAPERLSLTLVKKTYQPGESPALEVRAPFAGTLVVSVEREKIFSSKSVSVPAGLSLVELPAVGNEHFPNAYVVGVLVRPPSESLRELPGVSFGIVPLQMDLSSREVDFEWTVPTLVKSRQGISVSLATGAPGAEVVLAAVDEGILQIIDFKTPDPFHHFYRKRGLNIETLSLFDDVLPQLSRRQGTGGGDDSPSFAKRHLNPVAAKRVKSYALFSGILTADSEGKVSYRFPTDKFHGEVRVMAMGASGRKFGASAHSVNVADPIVVEPSFPRFLAPQDIFDVPVLLYNQRPEKQDLTVELKTEGPVAVDGEAVQKLTLAGGGQKKITFHAKAKLNAGKAVFKVEARDSEDGLYDVETELAVRPANPLTTEVHYGELSPSKENTLAVPGGFIPHGQKMQLVASSSPLLTFLRSMDYLLTYPYGCTEQRISQAFPLLSFKEMGLLTGRFSGRAGELDRFVQAAVDEVLAREVEEGAFAPWPSSTRRNDYLSDYASHFLLEAKKKGYAVPETTINHILKRIGAIQMSVVQKGGRLDRRKANIEIEQSTYMLYLKALVGSPDRETMNRFRDSGRKDFFLSLAFSAVEDRGSALQVLPAVKLPDGTQRKFWEDWFSPNKHGALYLLALTRAEPTSPKIKDMIIEFGKAMKNGHFGTTHDNAWCFMALGEAVKTMGEMYPLEASWKVVGGIEKNFKGDTEVVAQRELSGREVQIKNNGIRSLYYHLMAEGTKLESKKDTVSNGLTVSREYRDEKGNTVNLGSVAQGQLVVVTLNVKCAKALDNLVVVDLLPGGFEVDNPRLASRGKLGFDPPSSFTPAYQDFRDDRVLLFSESVIGELSFSYSVRAVTPGKFQVPGLLAEAMYDPEIFGRYNENQVLVVAPTAQ